MSLAAWLVAFPLAFATPDGGPLAPALADVLSDRALRGVDVGVVVTRLPDGEVAFAQGADLPLNGASTMKIVTAAAALRTLGPAWRFATVVSSSAPPDADGVLHGDLYIVVSGDPTLVVEDLYRLARDLKLAGVSKVDGHLIFDSRAFAPGRDLVGWDKPADVENGPAYFPTLGALALNYNTVGIALAPGPAVGSPARVAVDTPVGDLVEIANEMTTGTAGSDRSLRIQREVLDGGRMKFTVRGSVPADAPLDREYRAVADPDTHFMAAFREMLREVDITVSGRAKLGPVDPDARTLARHTSSPLGVILADMNKHSNNFIAEQTLRAVGGAFARAPGSNENGVEAVRAYLEGLGVDPSGDVIVNGSGLAVRAGLRPSTLVAVLRDMDQDPMYGDEFRASLSIAGVDGTLARRSTADPGRFRGKTGSLDGVHCLVGIVRSDGGSRYAFAFLANDIDGGNLGVRRVQDAFVEALAMTQADEVALGGPP